MNEMESIERCPITGDMERHLYFDLGDFPLVNNLNDSREESLGCKRYPLAVNFFPASGLTALTHSVDGSLLFDNYLFKSEVNIPYIHHCERMYDYISGLVKLHDGDLLVDIGGNDGTLLSAFKSTTLLSLEYLNVDPSRNLSERSLSKGIPVLTEFFSEDTPDRINGKARVVTSTNVFQHLRDINAFVEGVVRLLHDEGIWVLEFPYWIHDLKTMQFDQIYHEHVYYYSITPLKLMMEKHGLKIIRVEKQRIHGGTLRLVMSKIASAFMPDDSIERFLEYERPFDAAYHADWGRRVWAYLEDCRKTVSDIKARGERIVAFGAAAKGCIFLNALGLTDREIDCIIDDTDIKQGKFMPGTGIRIVGRKEVDFGAVDHLLILAHNFADYIIDSLRGSYNGRYLSFLPVKDAR